MKLRIGTDVDQCICDFMGPYLERFGIPKNDYEITRNVQRILSKDRDFWLNLPLINRPDFTPSLYCSKRVNPKAWSKEYLRRNDIPDAPFYQLFTQTAKKSRWVKGRCDVFIDDSLSNFIEMNLAGVPCLLMDSEDNQSWGPVARIYSLNYDEIEEAYYLFKDTLFNCFKSLLV